MAAFNLYSTAIEHTDLHPTLTRRNYPLARLHEELALVEETRTATQDQKRAIGDAQRATQQLNGAFDTLEDWTTEYREVLLVALAEQRQLLETVGIPARSTRRRPSGIATPMPTVKSRPAPEAPAPDAE